MHRTAFLLAILLLACVAMTAISGCQHSRPPAELVKAMKTVETQVDVYVEESNWALDKAQHPDKDVLIGTGLRIRNAVKALSWWAQEASGTDNTSDVPAAPAKETLHVKSTP